MSAFDYFDKIYCVNLPESNDRWATVNAEFCKIGIDKRIVRMSAPRPNKNLYLPNMRKAGQFGCTMSHLKVIGNALADANGPILIFEDDIQLAADSDVKVQAALEIIPSTWDIIYFGGQPADSLKSTTNPEVFVANDMRGSYGYAINAPAIRRLFNHIVDSMMDDNTDVAGIYDYILGKFSHHANSFAIYPLISHPVECVSIVQNGHRNYDDVVATQWKTFMPSEDNT